MTDPLKQATAELIQRRVLRQDAGIAALERQLLTAADHHGSIAALCDAMADAVAGMPKRIERQMGGLAAPAMVELTKACGEQAQNLRDRAAEARASRGGSTPLPDVPVALQRLSLGRRSRLVRGSK